MKKIRLFTAAIVFPCWLTTSVEAQIIFQPPNYEPADVPPAHRSQGGTRGPITLHKIPLTALIPETRVGLTVAQYPTFFVYVPQTSGQASGQAGEFILLDEDDNLVYKTLVTLPSQTGVVSFSLPNTGTLSPLEVGKRYHWEFGIIDDFNDHSGDLFVEGWIQRVEPSPELIKKLEQAAPKNRPALYAAAGIWHETLAILAELRRSTPDDPTLAQQWAELLKSKAVELDEIAQEPLGGNLSALDQMPPPPPETENVRERSEAREPDIGEGQFSPPEFERAPRTTGGGTR